MPRKSHRRRWRKRTRIILPEITKSVIALEEQDMLRQESNRVHIYNVVKGHLTPPDAAVIKKIRKENQNEKGEVRRDF